MGESTADVMVRVRIAGDAPKRPRSEPAIPTAWTTWRRSRRRPASSYDGLEADRLSGRGLHRPPGRPHAG
jgi:hypothetical protein